MSVDGEEIKEDDDDEEEEERGVDEEDEADMQRAKKEG